LVGTGSELSLAVEAADTLAAEGINAAVVSLPSFERFAEQTEDYQTAVLGGSDIPIVAVEAALRFGWDGIVGQKGGFVGMTGFGASAPAGELYKHFGITKEAVAQAARVQISGKADQ
ncbi:MAG: transketolase, partial [Verrucomicrobia bacterium]|nr:transketolase [Verrucomicrobiota bacterium]